jgi:hypothetical protein
MKFHVTYRLMHPNYFPATKVAIVGAETHASLHDALVSLKTKWEMRGYDVRILRVRADSSAERRIKKASFGHKR